MKQGVQMEVHIQEAWVDPDDQDDMLAQLPRAISAPECQVLPPLPAAVPAVQRVHITSGSLAAKSCTAAKAVLLVALCSVLCALRCS